MENLTPRQELIFNIIKDYSAKNGCSPTVREIMARTDILSPNGVVNHLKALERKKKITRDENVSRGIKIIPQEIKLPLDFKSIKIGPVTIKFENNNLKNYVVIESPYDPEIQESW